MQLGAGAGASGTRGKSRARVSNSRSTGTHSSLPAAAAPLPVPSAFTGEASGRPSPPGPSWRRMREAARAGGDYFPRPAPRPRAAERSALSGGRQRRRDTRCLAAYKLLLVRRHLKPSLGGGRVSSCPAQLGGPGRRRRSTVGAEPSARGGRGRAHGRRGSSARAALRCGAAVGRLEPRQRETSRSGWAAGGRGGARGRSRGWGGEGGRAPGARMDGWPPWGGGDRGSRPGWGCSGRGGGAGWAGAPPPWPADNGGAGRPRAQGTPDWRASPPSVVENV